MSAGIPTMQSVLSTLQAQVLVARRSELGREWRYHCNNDPFGRLYFIESGEGFIWHHKKTFHLTPGRMYLIPAHVDLRHACPDRIVIHWLHFTAVVLGGMSLFDFVSCRYAMTPADLRRTYAILERMQELHEHQLPSELIEMNGLLFQLLAEFVTAARPERSLKNEGALRFRPVLEHMDANLGTVLRVTQLARMAHLEPTYFSHLFARHFGVSPIQCLIRKRIEKAQGLLLQGDEKLEALAARLGFRDAFHFSKTFKRLTGLSPSRFRIQRRRSIP